MNLSDMIEKFILDSFEDDLVTLSRNDMAKYFDVSPSQINYVISTRFNNNKGYDIESKRGGDGYIKIYKLNTTKDDFISNMLSSEYVKKLDYFTFTQILEHMHDRLIVSNDEYNLLKVALSDKALKSPVNIEDNIRANIFKQVLLNLLKGGGAYDM